MHDRTIPDPAPSGFQSVVTSELRRPSDIVRSQAAAGFGPGGVPEAFMAANGATFTAVLQANPLGSVASFEMFDALGERSQRGVMQWRLEADAVGWLDETARLLGFSAYPIERRL